MSPEPHPCETGEGAPLPSWRRPVMRIGLRDMAALDVDVLVVGAGPAGVAAGIEATRLGCSTLVIDKARFPRDKTCGDGLTAGALRLLERPRARRPAAPVVRHRARDRDRRARRPRGRAPAARRRRVRGRGPARASSTPRSCSSRARRGRRRARRRGITALAHRHTDALVATLDDGTRVAASWVVAADGHYSADAAPARRPGAATRADLGTWHAFRQYFRGVDDPRLWVLFERDLLPGYAWVFPLGDGRANVGFGVLRDARHGRQAARRAVARRRRAARACAGSSASTPSPTVPTGVADPGHVRAEAALTGRPRTLFAGDAAGVVDPMTGEGIAQALETGMLAAHAVADGGHPSNVAAQLPRARSATRARRRPALRGRAATHPALTDRRARGDRRRRPHRLDAPQLRALDVRGLPPRGRHDAAALATGHVHATRRILSLTR